MVKIVGAAGVAALVLCGWALAGAPSQGPSVAPAPSVTTEHLDASQGAAACSQYAWPYYDGACLHGARGPVREALKVRFVVIDRLPPRAGSAD